MRTVPRFPHTMIFNSIFFVVIFLLSSCRHSTKTIKQKISNADIIGCWELNGDEISYPSLDFKKDSTAIFTSRADTVYSFKYWIADNYLMLQDNQNVFKCPITDYQRDSFSFEDVIINKKKLSYNRITCPETTE